MDGINAEIKQLKKTLIKAVDHLDISIRTTEQFDAMILQKADFHCCSFSIDKPWPNAKSYFIEDFFIQEDDVKKEIIKLLVNFVSLAHNKEYAATLSNHFDDYMKSKTAPTKIDMPSDDYKADGSFSHKEESTSDGNGFCYAVPVWREKRAQTLTDWNDEYLRICKNPLNTAVGVDCPVIVESIALAADLLRLSQAMFETYTVIYCMMELNAALLPFIEVELNNDNIADLLPTLDGEIDEFLGKVDSFKFNREDYEEDRWDDPLIRLGEFLKLRIPDQKERVRSFVESLRYLQIDIKYLLENLTNITVVGGAVLIPPAAMVAEENHDRNIYKARLRFVYKEIHAYVEFLQSILNARSFGVREKALNSIKYGNHQTFAHALAVTNEEVYKYERCPTVWSEKYHPQKANNDSTMRDSK